MKNKSSIALGLVAVILMVWLTVMKNSDNSRLTEANNAITDFSNRLNSAQANFAGSMNSFIAISNMLNECESAALAFSNQLTTAQAKLATQSGQLTDLNHQLAAANADNKSLADDLATVTNQLTSLNKQLAVTQSQLTQTNIVLNQILTDYVLLQNRFLRDVAARVVAERRFNNLQEVQKQEQRLLTRPAPEVTDGSIYAGLNVQVTSNGIAQVIAPE